MMNIYGGRQTQHDAAVRSSNQDFMLMANHTLNGKSAKRTHTINRIFSSSWGLEESITKHKSLDNTDSTLIDKEQSTSLPHSSQLIQPQSVADRATTNVPFLSHPLEFNETIQNSQSISTSANQPSQNESHVSVTIQRDRDGTVVDDDSTEKTFPRPGLLRAFENLLCAYEPNFLDALSSPEGGPAVRIYNQLKLKVNLQKYYIHLF
jgi:hypothetical protein